MTGTEDTRPRVLILADDITVEGGVRTRVLDEISIILDSTEILLVTKVRLRNFRLVTSTRKLVDVRCPGVKVIFVPFLPHHGFPLLREMLVPINVAAMTAIGIITSIKRRAALVYTHNLECTVSGLVLGELVGIPVVGDFHGDEVEEEAIFNMRRRGGLVFRMWRRMQRFAVNKVARVVCVSERQRAYFEKAFGRVRDYFVIPCCTNSASFPSPMIRMRRPSSGLTLFYAGSPFKHQMMSEMAKLFDTIHDSRPDSNFLFLLSESNYSKSVMGAFADRCRSSVEIQTVPHERVQLVAQTADIALLLREDTLFNNIASPTKFAEYLCAGLPVMMTDGIGDFSGLLEKEHLGRIVDLKRIGDSQYVSGLVDSLLTDVAIRERCARYAQEHLTWRSYEDVLRKVFTA